MNNPSSPRALAVARARRIVGRAVRDAAADDAVPVTSVAGDPRAARVHATHMGPDRAAVAAVVTELPHVVEVVERLGRDRRLGGVGVGREDQRRPVAPAPAQLRRDQLLRHTRAGRLPGEELREPVDVLLQHPQRREAAVGPQRARCRDRIGMPAELAGITKQELAHRRPRKAIGQPGRRDTVHGGLGQPVPVPEMRHIPGQAFPVAASQLPPPRRPRPLQPPGRRLQRGRRLREHHQHQVQIRISEPAQPPLRATVTDITHQRRPRHRPFGILGRETRPRLRRNPKRPQPGEGEAEIDTRLRLDRPRLGRGNRRNSRIVGNRREKGPRPRRLLHRQPDAAGHRHRVSPQDQPLHVAEIDRDRRIPTHPAQPAPLAMSTMSRTVRWG